jgi:hypothetical protein
VYFNEVKRAEQIQQCDIVGVHLQVVSIFWLQLDTAKTRGLELDAKASAAVGDSNICTGGCVLS